ncbi:MAG: MFS transporter [Candidatus Bathyarchaeota archaeon]|nr:MFS transporter [Candidatus Bathyarchaeota archaeon]
MKCVGLGDVLRREFSFISGNFRILVLSWVVMDLAMEMPSPNFQYYVQALGGTGVVLGIIGFANFLAVAAVAFPGGYLADKYGRRWLISTMTFGMSLSYLFFALAPSWHFILLGSIVNSLCLIYQPALFAMVQDSLPPERRGMGSSIIQLIHGTFNTPGPLIAGFLLLQFGLVTSMRIVYLIVTLLFLTAAVLRLRLKEVMTKGESIRFSYFISSYPKAIRESFSVWKVVPRSMWWLFVVQTFVMFGIALTQVINAIYARDVLLIPEEQWWLVYIPLLLTLVVASIPIGKIVDKFGRKTPMVVGLLVLGASTLLFVTANLPIAMISMCLLAIGQLLGMSTVMALATDLVPPANRGKVNGFTNFISSVMMGFGMLLGNYLYVNLFPQLPFYVAAALIVPEVLVVLFLVHEPEKRVGDT